MRQAATPQFRGAGDDTEFGNLQPLVVSAIVGHGATSHKHNVTPVSDVAVFGIPDPEFGKSLAAHGELVPGADIIVEGIRAHAAAHMAKYKVPKLVVFEAQLHCHDTGKLFKRKLGEQYWHHRTKA